MPFISPRRPALAVTARAVLPIGTALTCLLAGAATATPAPRPAGADVDLAIADAPVQLSPGQRGVQRLTVSNAAKRATTGVALVSYATPPYTNVDRKRPLPGGCRIAYQNQDPVMPEIVTCRLGAGLAKGKDRTVAIPVVVTDRARLTGTVRGRSSVMPAPGSKDVEVDTNNNWVLARLNLTRPTPPLPKGNKVGLWVAQADAVIAKDNTGELELSYGNTGPNETRRGAVVVVTTPLLVKIDTEAGLPDECTLALDDRTPGIPQVVRCTLDDVDVEEDDTFTLPLVAQPGAPKGMSTGTTLVAPGHPEDVDTDQVDNVGVAVARIPVRTP
ncbi:hypothetical protein G6045_02285 [Streptomyces sp. YC504]|uniref:Uncharacterized protein n=1 Tax=Streptomyces mesophilus TaxID=1775132 RepID=A0A6G4XCF0_9ACTN|nr:hypothetical protein [Streptomyces mesophilus]NGO74517.1 hypothetical protein [Streptomyces mesophilus]